MNAVPSRPPWLAQFGALVVGTLFMTAFPWLVPPLSSAPSLGPGLRLGLAVFGALAVLAGSALAQRGLPEPPERGATESERAARARAFQSRSTLAMALADVGATVGFVLHFALGTPVGDQLALSAGTLVVLAAVILPRGLAFWSAFEEH